MITKLLSTAIKFYLRSQIERVEDLQLKIVGKNSQILKGYIPQVFLSCQQGVYKGLHLREVKVNSTDIAFNLPEVLKRKPFRLLEPIVAQIELGLNGNDLQASLDSSLLQSGLNDLWRIILSADKTTEIDGQLADSPIKWTHIAIADDRLHLSGTYLDKADKNRNINLLTDITLTDECTLCLFPVKIDYSSDITYNLADKLEIDLGDVAIAELIIRSKQIRCVGKITIDIE